jgi:Outer membrane protein beta-barrel domain
MKKVIALVFTLVLFGTAAFSQGVSGGIKAGLNLSNMDISGNGFSLDTKTLAGFHGGLYLTAMFNEHVGIQPEVLYSAQGCKIDVFNTNGTIKANYINIPILLRYNINDMFSLHAGPQIGILASAEGKSGSSSTDLKDNASSTDIAVAFGGTVDLPMKLNFTARYCLGLSDIDEDSNSTTKNNTFQISVGYKLF